jgi:hypothetical protein
MSQRQAVREIRTAEIRLRENIESARSAGDLERARDLARSIEGYRRRVRKIIRRERTRAENWS